MSNRNKFIYEHSIAMDKLSFLLESTYPKFKIDTKTEMFNEYVSDPELFSLLYNDGYVALESFSDFKTKIKNICIKIKEEVIKFIKKIQFTIAKISTKLQIKSYNKERQDLYDYLVGTIGFKSEDVSKFLGNYYTNSAMLEKKMAIYNKFFDISKSRSITTKDLELMKKALNEVDRQYKNSKGLLSRGSITRDRFTSILSNPDYFNFMISDMEEAHKNINNEIDTNENASVCNEIGNSFKDYCNTVSTQAKLYHNVHIILNEIATKYELPVHDSSLNSITDDFSGEILNILKDDSIFF